MIGPHYWSTGISVQPFDVGRWGARLEFFDDGFAEEGATQGTLETRYLSGDLGAQIDLLLTDARRLGIEFRAPTLYWPGDGEDSKVRTPKDWEEILQAQCERLGWRSSY